MFDRSNLLALEFVFYLVFQICDAHFGLQGHSFGLLGLIKQGFHLLLVVELFDELLVDDISVVD